MMNNLSSRLLLFELRPVIVLRRLKPGMVDPADPVCIPTCIAVGNIAFFGGTSQPLYRGCLRS